MHKHSGSFNEGTLCINVEFPNRDFKMCLLTQITPSINKVYDKTMSVYNEAVPFLVT